MVCCSLSECVGTATNEEGQRERAHVNKSRSRESVIEMEVSRDRMNKLNVQWTSVGANEKKRKWKACSEMKRERECLPSEYFRRNSREREKSSQSKHVRKRYTEIDLNVEIRKIRAMCLCCCYIFFVSVSFVIFFFKFHCKKTHFFVCFILFIWNHFISNFVWKEEKKQLVFVPSFTKQRKNANSFFLPIFIVVI